MGCFGSLRWRMWISRTSTGAIVKQVGIVAIGPTIGELSIGLRCSDLLLVTFRRAFLDFSIARINLCSPVPLSLNSTLGIERPGFAVCAEVINAAENILSWDDAVLIEIITLCMLPGVASFAVHSVSIVIFKATDAFDCVIFYLFTKCIGRILNRRRLNWSGYETRERPRRRRSVRVERKGIGHTMAENGRLLCDYEDRVVGIRGLNRMTCTWERDRNSALNSFNIAGPNRSSSDWGVLLATRLRNVVKIQHER